MFFQGQGANGVSRVDSGPYWSQLSGGGPRRFTEGPLEDQQETTETKPVQQDVHSEATLSQKGGEETTELARESVSEFESSARKNDSEDVKHNVPPMTPAMPEFVAPSMPPPSFLPPRLTSTTSPAPSEYIHVYPHCMQWLECVGSQMRSPDLYIIHNPLTSRHLAVEVWWLEIHDQTCLAPYLSVSVLA